jgi:hypothetical protein
VEILVKRFASVIPGRAYVDLIRLHALRNVIGGRWTQSEPRLYPLVRPWAVADTESMPKVRRLDWAVPDDVDDADAKDISVYSRSEFWGQRQQGRTLCIGFGTVTY